jgi:hypothetical protein
MVWRKGRIAEGDVSSSGATLTASFEAADDFLSSSRRSHLASKEAHLG